MVKRSSFNPDLHGIDLRVLLTKVFLFCLYLTNIKYYDNVSYSNPFVLNN
jgi:hypothetical protein